MDNVNYSIFRNESGDYQVLPKGGYIAPTLKEVPIQEFLTESKKTGWRPYGSNIIDPTVTNIDQARAKYGSGTGEFFTAGNTQFDTLMRNSQYADIINKLQQGQETSAGKMVDGNFTTNEALAQQQANEAAVKAGTMKVAQVVNGVPVYLPTQMPQAGQFDAQNAQTPMKAPAGVAGGAGTQVQNPAQQQTIQAFNQQTQQYETVANPQGRNLPSNITPQGYNFDGKQYALNPSTGRFEEVSPAFTAQNPTMGPVSSSPVNQFAQDGATSAVQRVVDMTNTISRQLGIPTIKQQIDKVIQDQKDLADAKQREVSDINNNPWLSQDIRNRELKKIDDRYSSKEATLANLGKLYDSMYQEANSQVKFLVGQAEDDIQKAMDIAAKKQEALDKLALDNQIVTANGRVVMINKNTGEIVADYGPSKTGGTSDTRLIQSEVDRIVSEFQTKMRQMGWRGVNPDDYDARASQLQKLYGTKAVASLKTAMNAVGIKVDVPGAFKDDLDSLLR